METNELGWGLMKNIATHKVKEKSAGPDPADFSRPISALPWQSMLMA
jgi:hypothetical protein